MGEPLRAGDPRQLGPFYLDGRLGSGGQGVVYEGYALDGRRVAVKVLHAVDEGDREQLRKEIRAWQLVEPYCTTRVLDADLDGPQPYVASEYVAGPNLRRAVAVSGPYGTDELRRLAVSLAAALVSVHRAGVVHRDLKPENILLGSDGPRVIDFGIARILDGTATAGLPMGTLRYMPPERYRGDPGGHKVDVWGWAALVLFASAGEDAFGGDNLAAIAYQVATHQPDTAHLEEPLGSLVRAALSKEPAGRPTSEQLLLSLVGRADLADVLHEAGSGGRPDAPAPSRAEAAESAFGRLEVAAQEAVPRVLLRLVAPGERAEDTLRSASRGEFSDGQITEPVLDLVLRELSEVQVLVLEDDRITLSTAALIRSWRRLRDWVEAERAGLGIHQRLSEAARVWEAHGRQKSDLLQGTALENARDWAATGRRHLTLNQAERALLDAGAQLSRRRGRVRALVSATLSLLLVAALAAGGFAFSQWRAATAAQRATNAAQRDTESRLLAAESTNVAGSDPDLASLLAVRAWQVSHTDEAAGALYRAPEIPLRRILAVDAKAVRVVAFSPDGATLATGSDDATVRLWDVRTGHLRVTLTGHHDAVSAIAFSPDSATVATGSDDGTVRLWEVNSGSSRGVLDGAQTDAVTSVAFSPDGTTLAVAGGGAAARLWNVRTGTVDTPPSHGWDTWGVHAVAYGPDGAPLATGDGGDGTTRVWNLRTGVLRGRLSASTGIAGSAAFSPDGTILATDDNATAIHLWTSASGALRSTTAGRYDWTAQAAFSADDRTLATGTRDGAAQLWDVATGKLRATLTGHPTNVMSLAFSPDGATLATGSLDGTVRLWNVTTDSPRAVLAGRDGGVSCVAFSPDGATLAVGALDGTVRLWDAGTGRSRAVLAGSPKGALSVAFSPDGATLAAGYGDGTLRLWDVRTGAWRATLTGHTDGVLTTAFSPDGRTLATGALDDTARLWEVPAGTPRAALTGITKSVLSVAFSRDGTTLAAGDEAGAVRLWDVRTHSPRATLSGYANSIWSLAFSPDGATLAAAGNDGALLEWDVRTGLPRAPLAHLPGALRSVAFSPDGRTLAAGSDDGVVRLWDTASNSQRATLIGHTDGTDALVFSPDGATLATGSFDGSARLWDVRLPGAQSIADALCRSLHRNFTADETHEYVRGQDSTPSAGGCAGSA